jgi:hypothetical protein
MLTLGEVVEYIKTIRNDRERILEMYTKKINAIMGRLQDI